MSMPEDKPLRYRELLYRLKKFGVQEKIGKGSRRILYHPNINGNPAFGAIHPHSEHYEFSRKVVKITRRRFNIPIEEFYK